MDGREVLIHLNITVGEHGGFTDEAAIEAAQAYCYRHNIPVDDVVLIDPQ